MIGTARRAAGGVRQNVSIDVEGGFANRVPIFTDRDAGHEMGVIHFPGDNRYVFLVCNPTDEDG